MIVEVALPLPVDRTYSYTVPAELSDAIAPGIRVLVPFGKRRLTGVVTAVADAIPEQPLKSVEEVLDDLPPLSDELLRLTRWIADYYVCAWGEALRAALPPGADVSSRTLAVAVPEGRLNKLDPVDVDLVERVRAAGRISVQTLRKSAPGATLSRLRRLERDGLIRLEEDLRGERVRPKTATHLSLAESFRTPPASESLLDQLRGPKQVAIVRVLLAFAEEGVSAPRQADVLERAEASAAAVNALVNRGILVREVREVFRSGLPDDEERARRIPTLHPAQKTALEAITAALSEKRYHAFLLHGVTGSGKTEVYIAALKTALAAGRTGIVLGPEIALTPQTVGRFRAHFGDEVAVLHSRMSLGERYDAWRRLRDGTFRIAIGPRSAILAPLSNVGLIVVDEEHESSYKQVDPAPRYHARDVAVMRAHQNGAVCVLGSATPSLESWLNATEAGKYTLLEMPDRVPVEGHAAAPLPEVRIVDLVKERKRHRLDGVFSMDLIEAMKQRLERREQIILLQNRRGFAPVVECSDCGWVPECPDCSVSMAYHKARRHLKCHYCGRAMRLPTRCPQCGSDALDQLGAGTQRVEEELGERLPGARVLRMDLDTTTRKQSHHEILSRFRRGEADVLLGTQMVAKGLDFPRVTLVGVVNTDTGLLLPDFRAEERTFQLLTQVAGRAGRADLRGEVILQSRNVDHPVLSLAAGHDYRAFAQLALEERRAFRWPPYVRLVVVEFSGPEEPPVREMAADWTANLRELGPDLNVADPTPALVSRVKRRHRYRTVIRAERGRTPDVQETLRAVMEAARSPRAGYRISIDVDAGEAV
ncbi:MAG TPA: primosomal protein N' [Rhodothermales bacterium]